MKRIIKLTVALVAVAVAGVSCLQLEQPGLNENLSGNDSGTVQTVRVRMEGGATKVDISGATGAASWTTGDQVAYCVTDGSTTQYNVSTVDIASGEISLNIPSGYHRANFAVYPAAARGSNFTAPTVVYPTSYDLAGKTAETFAPCPMVASNTGTDLEFYHVGGVLRLYVEAIPSGTKSLVVVFAGMTDVTGTYSVSNAGTSGASCTLSSGTGNAVTFTNGGSDFASSTYLNVPVPAVNLSDMQDVVVRCKDSSGNILRTMGKVSRWGTAVRAKGRMASLAGADIRHPFSVSASRKVVFAPGNLQCTIASGPTDTYNYTGTDWRFASSQWEMLGSTDSANSFTIGKKMDLFGWVGESASYDTYGLCSLTSTNNAYYGTSDADGLKTDWGDIPGVIFSCGDGWFTPSNADNAYLFDGRATGNTVNGTPDARYTVATIRTDVSGVNGIILFPDDYSAGTPSGVTWGTINAGSAWGTQCTAAGWASLEAAGCVFIPAAGYRSGGGVDDVGGFGYYWSSSPRGVDLARYVYFYSGGVNPQNDYYRLHGFSVRLARES